MSETYNLERQQNLENSIDPTGKKWTIVHIKGTALYEARPEPYRSDIVTPGEFEGRWTKPSLLQDQISLFLNRAWDKAEAVAQKMERKAHASKQAAKEEQKTAEESLSEIDPEIKEFLGESLGKFYADMSYPELVDLAKEKGIDARKKVDIIAALNEG